MSGEKINILITAAGGGGTNGIIASIPHSKYYFVGVNSDFYKAAASISTPVYHIPHSSYEANYIKSITDIVRLHDIKLVIPNSDSEVEVISRYQNSLPCKTFIPDNEICKTSNDKWLTHQFCTLNKINVPRTLNAHSLDQWEETLSKELFFPMWIRIRYGSGSKFTKKANDKIEVLNFIEESCADYDLSPSDFLVSEYLPGDDCLIFTIWNKGELQYLAMAHRMEYFGKQGQSAPTLIKREYRRELHEMAIKIGNSTVHKPHGVYNFDIKYDSDGRPALTEINIGRFYYNMPLFIRPYEINPFDIYVKIALDEEKNLEPIISKSPLFFLRDQDNFPVVLTHEELQSKVKSIHEC